MDDKFLKPYDAQATEPSIYKKWEESGLFNPDIAIKKGITKADAEPYSIMLPPPNVTGILHMGSALMLAIEDILIRFRRMQGRRTLWLPGTDHAAIATQSKVEKEISKKEGKSRYDLGREELLRRIELFAKESHDSIVSQMKRMGASLDWSREAFTLDETRNRAVRTIFKNMYDDGLIYRGNRIVNWDPKGQTTISDEEIVYEERAAKLYTFKYSADFPISISTSRPETKVGDTAVAVHPDDARYKDLVGTEYDLVFAGVPLHIKIIADKEVDPTFGTGALGVTPAHSQIDWAMSERHNLPRPQVINEYAKMTVGGPELLGKKTTEAREVIVAWLRDQKLLEKEEDIKQNISTAERTGGIVEPLPKLQWFIDVHKKIASRGDKSLKELMQTAVKNEERDGPIEIMPAYFAKTYFHWIDNLRDWCISRQIWYGHRIPVWYCSCGATITSIEAPTTCETCMPGKDVVFGVAHKDAEPRSSIIAYVEDATGEKILTIHWKDELGGKLLVGGGLEGNEDPLLCAKREIAEETGYTDLEYVGKIENKITNHYYAYSKKVLRTIDITALHFKLKSNTKKEPQLEENEQGKFSVEWSDKATLASELKDPAHAYVLRTFAKIAPTLSQDPDTLDTWFSAGIWTFSTLGWPQKTEDFKTYHPTNVIETGYDILPFWVSRMILMTEYALGEIPFKKVYLHGLVRDAQGRKISKSLGNNIDPIDIANKYGADAGRFALIAGTAPGTDSKISEDKIKGYKHFANKIWNIARFILSNNEGVTETQPTLAPNDIARIEELQAIAKEVTSDLEAFRLHLASEKIYHYIWHTLADVIIEESKPRLAGTDEADKLSAAWTLRALLRHSLILLHPFMPFVTEEIWGSVRYSSDQELLMVQLWG